MGQARLRGSFEERKVNAEKVNEALAIAKMKEVSAYEASLTPEQKAKSKKAKLLLATALAMTI